MFNQVNFSGNKASRPQHGTGEIKAAQTKRHSLTRKLNRNYLVLSLLPFIALFLCTLAGAFLAKRHVADLINGSMHQLGVEIKTYLITTGEEIIRSRAREVARQIELLVGSQPGVTIEELQQSEVVRRIALQRVGLTGYTCLYEAGSGTMRIHPNPELIDRRMEFLAEKLPSWWNTFEPSLAGAEVSGYYDWLEEDGRITQKYMVMTPAGVSVGGRKLMVAATTYMEEFFAPVYYTRVRAGQIAGQYGEYVSRQSLLIAAVIAAILTATVLLVSWLSRRAAARFVLPIQQLAETAAGFGRDMTMPVEAPALLERPDEIGELAGTFNRMRIQITDQFKRLNSGYERLWKAQQALSESEGLYRGLFENVPIGIYRSEPGGRVIDVNPALVNMFGYPDKEMLLSRPAAEMYADPRDREIFKDMVNGRRPTQPCEFQMRRLDGGVIWVENQGVAVRNADGRTLYYEGTLKDITERKLAQEALRRSEERFRTAFENASVGMCLVGLDGVFLEVNAALASMIGYAPFDLVGKPVTAFTHPDDLALRLQFVNGLVSGKFSNGQQERRFNHQNGSVVWTLIWSNLQKDPAGRPLHFISLVQDISERKKAEEELKLVRFCVEHAAVAIFRVADDARIMEVNEHACRSLGYSRPELLGMTIFDIDPTTPPEKWAEHRRKLAQERVRIIRAHHRRKDGTRFPVEVTANYIEKDGRGFSYSFATDISGRLEAERDREKLESQLRQAQQMEAIGTLAGGIAHDFNNILSVIIGNADILDFANGLAEAERSCLRQILDAGQRAKQLVKQIMTFSRRGGQQRLLVDLKPVVKETFGFLKATLPSSVEVRQRVPAEVGTILADPTQMQQVLMNLCTNAAHAMEGKENAVLEIGLEKTFLTKEETRFEPDVEPGEFVKLMVTDNGSGIDPLVQKRIFEPYFTTKEPGKGTGLGLSVVHGIVKAHGGFVKVRSEVGKGTSFQVFFPIASEGRQAAVPAADRMPPGGSETILLVDDEKALADMTQHMLERLGYRVETRTSPLEAIEAFRAHPTKYHAVITDMTMPQMNGISLSKKLLEMRGDLPILLCTGFSDQANEEKARANGIREFAFKPLALSDLAKTLRKMLDEANAPKPAPAAP
jgi:PAS domain S-box-containing protein